MNHSISMILLSAGIVLSLAGCQKDHTGASPLSGKAVRFAASSKSVETRTAFSGEGTVTDTDEFGRNILSWERIDWEVGNQVMIASDEAILYETPSVRNAVYTVESVTAVEDGKVSEARVEELDSEDELFFTSADSYTFWGVYPATVGDGATLETGKVNYALSASQEAAGTPETKTNEGRTKTLTILKPAMDQAVMLAKAENVTTEKVDLEFYPAFTTFEFTLLAKENVEIPLGKVVFSSNSDIAGSVAATIGAGGNNEYTYSSTGKEITFTFPDNTVITKTEYLTFTFFALPQKVEGLTMAFYDPDDNLINRGSLKQNGADIDFAACKKHSLRGVAVKSGWEFSSITLNLEAIDWVPVTKDTDDYLQASQFEITGAATEDSNTRQLWHVEEGNSFKISYKVFLPVGGTWSIVPAGDTDQFTITGDTSGSVVNGGTRITLEITPKTGSTGKKLHFNTYVTAGGVQYNLDSETQLYDIRGYHYFLVD